LDGTLAQVKWEQSTPGTLTGVYTYHYDANGNLIKSTDNPVQETVYTWEGNQITKSERIKNNELVEYNLFGYDEAGNVGEVAQFNKQPNGDFVMSLLFVYLYYTDGNLYKQLTYNPNGSQDIEDFILISTYIYDNYLNVVNPVPMLEIIPNRPTQLNLPHTYRVESNGSDITYQFSYTFDDQGRPTQRTATSGITSEITNYQYFD
jgi:YD repeat-containing protein